MFKKILFEPDNVYEDITSYSLCLAIGASVGSLAFFYPFVLVVMFGIFLLGFGPLYFLKD